MLKSATTSSLREYNVSENFDSDISPIKRQIACMATLSLYKSGTIFRTRPFRINRLSVCWDLGMFRQKQYDLVIENVLWRDFIEVRMLGTMSELRHIVTSHSDSAVRPAVDALS